MTEIEYEVLADINELREAAGAVPYAKLPVSLSPIHAALQHLYNADLVEITPYRIRWLQLEVVDLEEDALLQYDTIVVHTVETPLNFVRFLYKV
jgi:hypothetical protein